MDPVFESVTPVLRIFSVEKALEFYSGFLGLSVHWEHGRAEGLPVYMQVSRPGLVLHLSEHHGDCCPGAAVFVRLSGLDAFHAEITSHEYRYMRPGIEPAPWGGRVMTVTDPFGNRLLFAEPAAAGQSTSG